MDFISLSSADLTFFEYLATGPEGADSRSSPDVRRFFQTLKRGSIRNCGPHLVPIDPSDYPPGAANLYKRLRDVHRMSHDLSIASFQLLSQRSPLGRRMRDFNAHFETILRQAHELFETRNLRRAAELIGQMESERDLIRAFARREMQSVRPSIGSEFLRLCTLMKKSGIGYVLPAVAVTVGGLFATSRSS